MDCCLSNPYSISAKGMQSPPSEGLSPQKDGSKERRGSRATLESQEVEERCESAQLRDLMLNMDGKNREGLPDNRIGRTSSKQVKPPFKCEKKHRKQDLLMLANSHGQRVHAQKAQQGLRGDFSYLLTTFLLFIFQIQGSHILTTFFCSVGCIIRPSMATGF